MREHFTGLVDEQPSARQPRSGGACSTRCATRSRTGTEARRQVRETGVVGLIASPEQRAVIDRIGGLMSLLEGHGDVTMRPRRRRSRARRRRVSPRCCRPSAVAAQSARQADAATDRASKASSTSTRPASGSSPRSRQSGGPRVVDVCWRVAGEPAVAGGDPRPARWWLGRVPVAASSPDAGRGHRSSPTAGPAARSRRAGTEVTCAVSGGADSIGAAGAGSRGRCAVDGGPRRPRPAPRIRRRGRDRRRGSPTRFGADVPLA